MAAGWDLFLAGRYFFHRGLLMPTGAFMAATMVGEDQGRTYSNVLHYEQLSDNSGGFPPSQDSLLLAQGLRALSAEWTALFPSSYVFKGCYVQSVDPVPVPVYPAFATTSVTGTRTGEPFQSGVGPLLLRGPATITDDRSQVGRTYLGVVSEDDVTAGIIDSGLITAIDAFWFLGQFVTQAGADFQLGTYSQQNRDAAGTFFWPSEVFRVARGLARISRRKPRY